MNHQGGRDNGTVFDSILTATDHILVVEELGRISGD